MFAGARGFDRGIEREQIGLVRDVVDDADLLRDLLHRLGGGNHRFATLHGLLGGLGGHAVGDTRVLGVLADRCGHLLQRSTGLFHTGGLFACRLRQRLRGGADFFRRAGKGFGAGIDLADHLRQLPDHGAHRFEQLRGFVAAVHIDTHGEIAFRQAVGHRHRAADRPGDAAADYHTENGAEQHAAADDGDQQPGTARVDRTGFRVGRRGAALAQAAQVGHQVIHFVRAGTDRAR